MPGFEKGTTTKAEAMEAMTHTLTGEWPADGSISGGYMPIPMYGEKEVAKLDPSMNPITGISMKRMLARIDIRNSASNFTVEEVFSCQLQYDWICRSGLGCGRTDHCFPVR